MMYWLQEIKIMTSKIDFSCLLFFAMFIIFFARSSTSKLLPLNFLKDLNGTRKGDQSNGLIELKRYLEHLGYIDYSNISNTIHRNDDFFDDILESAIRKYQNSFNLKITGFLDQETFHLMSIPRCGVPDHYSKVYKNITGLTLPHYMTVKPWPENKRFLSFSYKEDEEEVGVVVSAAIATALGKWARYSPFRFRYSGFNDADLMIGFLRRGHGDPLPFDGFGGLLAHAFYPPDGRMHFDADDEWGVEGLATQVDVQSVALHEIGHLLGLGHSSVENAVMFPHMAYGKVKRYLTQDDIDGIKALYPHG